MYNNSNYYNEIKKNLLKCEIYDREKDYSKERNRVITYFEYGRLLAEAGKKYGVEVIAGIELSAELDNVTKTENIFENHNNQELSVSWNATKIELLT